MKFKRFMALAIAGVMTLGMAGTAIADGVTTDSLKITKSVDADTNVNEIKDKVKFLLKDTAPFVTPTSGEEAYKSAGSLFANGEEIEIGVTKGDNGFSGEFDIDSKIKTNITKPGVYFLELTENTNETETAFGWTKTDKTKYLIAAFAKLKEGSTKEYSVTYEVYKASAEGKPEGGKTSLNFNNTYNGDSGADGNSLEFKKTLGQGGEYVDASTMFKFTATLTYPTQATKVEGKITGGYASAGAADKTDITVSKTAVTSEDRTQKIDFFLKANDTANFVDLPVGTTVVIKEDTNIDNWTSITAEGVELDGTDTTKPITLKADTTTAGFKNNFSVITPTGLAINVAPFVAMFAAVGAAIALYVAAKRRVR